MELATFSTIAQIVAAFAVLITLIYLAVQTRQNTLAIRGRRRCRSSWRWSNLVLGRVII